MPQLGDVGRGKDVCGRYGRKKVMWCACSVCGAERWVMVKKGIPRATMCRICAPQNHSPNRMYLSGPMHPNWKGGRREDSYGYVIVKIGKDQHPRCNAAGYVREHILVAEEILGRLLHTGEVVHHKDGNDRNNDRSNLAVYASQSDHLKAHHGKTPVTPVWDGANP